MNEQENLCLKLNKLYKEENKEVVDNITNECIIDDIITMMLFFLNNSPRYSEGVYNEVFNHKVKVTSSSIVITTTVEYGNSLADKLYCVEANIRGCSADILGNSDAVGSLEEKGATIREALLELHDRCWVNSEELIKCLEKKEQLSKRHCQLNLEMNELKKLLDVQEKAVFI